MLQVVILPYRKLLLGVKGQDDVPAHSLRPVHRQAEIVVLKEKSNIDHNVGSKDKCMANAAEERYSAK